MYSSDSDDDIIKKHDKLLSYHEDKAKITLNDSIVLNELEVKNNTIAKTGVSKGEKTKRKSVDPNIPSKRVRTSGKLSKTVDKYDNDVDAFIDLTDCDLSLNSNNINTRKSTKRQTAKSLQNASTNSDVILIDIDDESTTTNSIQNKPSKRGAKNTTRGHCSSIQSPRGRSTSRNRNATKSRGSSRGRGTTKGRSKAKITSRSQITRNRSITTSNSNIIPTYSIGNTHEYVDYLENVGLFSSSPKKGSISNNLFDESIENEEILVKVYWQSIDFKTFPIRRFQNIKVIYDFYSETKNIPINCLVFIYNDVILSPDDSPDSINYKVTKFIEGGVSNESKNFNTSVVKKSGVEIKFQCQKAKKPIIIYIEKDKKLFTAMTKCAGHLDMPLEKLKFEFDGDIITGSETLQDLEMEGGECIDVKIID